MKILLAFLLLTNFAFAGTDSKGHNEETGSVKIVRELK